MVETKKAIGQQRGTKTLPRLGKFKLAGALKISRTTLDTYLQKDGAPEPDKRKTYDVEAVRSFVATHSGANVEGSEMRDLRARKLRLETEALEHDMARLRGETITKTQIAPAIAAFNTELTANLRQKFEMELPSRYKGKGTIECQQMNAEAIDWVLARLKDGQWALGLEVAPKA